MSKTSQGPFQRNIYSPGKINLSLDNTEDLGTYTHQELLKLSTEINKVSNRFNQMVPQLWGRPRGDVVPMPSSGTWYRVEMTLTTERSSMENGVYDPVNHQLVFAHYGVATVQAKVFAWRSGGGNDVNTAALILHPEADGDPLLDYIDYDLQYGNFNVGVTMTLNVTWGIQSPPETYYLMCSHNNNKAIDMVNPIMSIAYLR